MKKNPQVSVIVPTRNSAKFLDRCLLSIKEQTYENIEIIVVDNNSTDNTREIARKYTDKVSNKGPERSVQRNFGVEKSKGSYLLFIDSDMVLSKDVVKNCVERVCKNHLIKSVVIPEESYGVGFWAKCKQLERSFYLGVDWIEAARFYNRDTFISVGGFDEDLVSGEDWDLSQRIEKRGKKDRILEKIYHNEGKISLFDTIRSKNYYAAQFRKYAEKPVNREKVKYQMNVFFRYWLFFSNPIKLFHNPFLGLGLLFMKTCEFTFSWMHYYFVKQQYLVDVKIKR